jgi:hypothetical protein
MAATSALDMINLHVGAEDACAADHAAGRLAADDKHHLRHGDPQTCPVGMDDAPERFAARLRETLPQMNAPRPPFNANSFNERPACARTMSDASRPQLRRTSRRCPCSRTAPRSASAQEIHAALEGPICDRPLDGWSKTSAVLTGGPAVQRAVRGLEIVDEPARHARCAEAEAARAAKRGSTRSARFMPRTCPRSGA